MKKASLFILFFLMTSCALFGGGSNEEAPEVRKKITEVPNAPKVSEDSVPRNRLMVLPFLDSSENRPQSLRDAARDEFINELNKTHRVIVIDSKDLKVDVTKSLKNGEYNLGEIAKEAQNLGISALLEGKVLDVKLRRKSDEVGVFRKLNTQFEAKVRMRIASTRSGKDLFNTVKTITIDESNVRVAETVDSDRFFQNNPEILENLVKEAFLDFTPQIVDTLNKLAWEGRIAMINGDRIFLNVGKISGLQLGDILKVTEEGEEVYDPQTGNYIGKVPGRLKGTLEVVSYFGQDGSIAIVHSGAGFKENDKVELY